MRSREVERDSIDVGRSLIGFWTETSAEPSSLRCTTSAGREYLHDCVGSSRLLNHYFVISGPKVAGQVNRNQYLFYRQLSKHRAGKATLNEVKQLYRNAGLTAQAARSVSGTDVHSDLGFPTPDLVANEAHFLERLAGRLQAEQLERLPFARLKRQEWDSPGGGMAIFERPHDEMSAAYDRLFASHRLDVAAGGVRPRSSRSV
jgi:hypothetical protein